MKPKKADFQHYIAGFNENIEERQLSAHVEDAFKFDIRPKLEMLGTDIYAHSGTSKPELTAFFNNYVLNWWVLLAYKRFIQIHGLNVVPGGMIKTRDPQGTFEQAGVDEKAVLLRQLNHDIGILYSYVLQQDWIFDNSRYRKGGSDCGVNHIDNSTGINAIE